MLITELCLPYALCSFNILRLLILENSCYVFFFLTSISGHIAKETIILHIVFYGCDTSYFVERKEEV